MVVTGRWQLPRQHRCDNLVTTMLSACLQGCDIVATLHMGYRYKTWTLDTGLNYRLDCSMYELTSCFRTFQAFPPTSFWLILIQSWLQLPVAAGLFTFLYFLLHNIQIHLFPVWGKMLWADASSVFEPHIPHATCLPLISMCMPASFRTPRHHTCYASHPEWCYFILHRKKEQHVAAKNLKQAETPILVKTEETFTFSHIT